MTEETNHDAEALAALLNRIPDGWARVASCGPGWHPLLLQLDAQLSELEPAYIVYQIKEKFGGLRFYFGVPEVQPVCCQEFKKDYPCPVPEHKLMLSNDDEQALMEWQDRLAEHMSTEECVANQEAMATEREEQLETLEKMRSIVNEFEIRSLTICEETGQRGYLMTQNGWYRTLAEEFEKKGWLAIGDAQHRDEP
jgi:hypothetical protein